jgi:hypothetical protein
VPPNKTQEADWLIWNWAKISVSRYPVGLYAVQQSDLTTYLSTKAILITNVAMKTTGLQTLANFTAISQTMNLRIIQQKKKTKHKT